MEVEPSVEEFLTKVKTHGRTKQLTQRHTHELSIIAQGTVLAITKGTEPCRLTTIKQYLKQLPKNPYDMNESTNAFVHTDMKRLSSVGLIQAKHLTKNAVIYLDNKVIKETLDSATSKEERAIFNKNLERWTNLPKRKGYVN